MKRCPVCENMDLSSVLTRQGVEVDLCPQCEGIWLDKDEIYFFTKFPNYIEKKFNEAILKQRPSNRVSPVSDKLMVEFNMFDGEVVIDYCPYSGGIWLDRDEIKKFPIDRLRINVDQEFSFDGKLDGTTYDSYMPNVRIGLLPLPNLILSSVAGVAGYYVLISLVLSILVLCFKLPLLLVPMLSVLIMVTLFLTGPIFMDLLLKGFYQVDWLDFSVLENKYSKLVNFIRETCKDKNIAMPLIGIIPDGAPQSFTYGYHANSSRLVVSEGLLDLLDEEELRAVTAHEIGHISRWDMLLITLFQPLPLFWNYIYHTCRRSEKIPNEAARYVISRIAYIFYIMHEMTFVWFSRVREYYADRFSGEVTGHPEKLCSALVKIGYSLAGKNVNIKEQNERQDGFKAIKAFGIFDEEQALSMVIEAGNEPACDTIKDAAKWDMWSPWALYYEVRSTHPLLAKRISMLNNFSEYLGRESYVTFDEKRPESFWVNFLFEVSINLAPVVFVIITLLVVFLGLERSGFHQLGMLVAALGLGYFLKLFMAYPSGEFAPMNVHALLKKIKVSEIRPVACQVKGKIIGRGSAVSILTDDIIFKDETGMIFLDRESPLAISNSWGVLKTKNFIDQDVEIFGWYRRDPVPYIETCEIRTKEERYKSHIYDIKFYWAVFLIFIGLLITVIF
ncbi:MAG: M48 family metalloprotease [Candidatus Omnitrophica bacterium]|nr:M48 family metalloprotease [Candidatus Omnitrophota bacterium]